MTTDPRTDIDFMDDLAAARHLKARRGAGALLWTICAMVAAFLVWSAGSKIEELTRGQGEVLPSGESQMVQSLEGGILSELLVHEGDRVKKGQVLMRLSDVAFASEERGTEAKLTGLLLRKARLEAESTGAEFTVAPDLAAKAPTIADSERALHASRQEELKNALAILEDQIAQNTAQIAESEAEISRLGKSVGLLREELGITQRMVAQKAVPKLEEIRLQRELSDAQGQLQAAKERKSSLTSALSAVRKQKDDQEDKFRTQALGELNTVQTDIAAMQESLKSMGDRVDRAELRAPADGVVNKVMLKTVGGVIEPAMKLVEIVPVDSALKIVAKVRPDDIAFLKEGQPAHVKITAYDSARFGRLEGKLTRVGAGSVLDPKGNPYFEIEVLTDRTWLGSDSARLPIMPGMVAEVEVVTGRRSVLSYLLKPVLRAQGIALTER